MNAQHPGRTLSAKRRFFLKNRVLGANLVSNMVGVGIVNLIMRSLKVILPPEVGPVSYLLNVTFIPFSVLTGTILIMFYEKPIRAFIDSHAPDADAASPELTLQAQRRLLNEPFFLMGYNISMWVLGGIIHAVCFNWVGAESAVIQQVFVNSFSAGLITVTVAFFAFEFIFQRFLVPVVFPNGGLHKVSGPLRVTVRMRLLALLTASNLLPFHLLLNLQSRVAKAGLSSEEALVTLQSLTRIGALIFIAVSIWLTFLIGGNLTRAFNRMVRALSRIRGGEFDQRLPVTSNDEVGYTAEVINDMAVGLQERERLQNSLDLAMEVQQHLLPQAPPDIPGLDVAAVSLYCDETGGDFFDYLPLEETSGRWLVAIGDVSDHGIAAALLMASARAGLRQRVRFGGTLNQIVTDLNGQLVEDVRNSGRFMTLLVVEIDPQSGEFEWVRAGHEPAFRMAGPDSAPEEMRGQGSALGVSDLMAWSLNGPLRLAPREVLVLATDGLWEVQNEGGHMLGRERVVNEIQRHMYQTAQEIAQRVADLIAKHRGKTALQDDLTLVIIKKLDSFAT